MAGYTTRNIVLSGVGGQGIITAARIIAEASLVEGRKVLVAETHGLSQRGGSVVVHVRVGDVEAPLIPPGMGDLMIGLEAIEAARYASLLAPGASVVLNKDLQPPPLPKVKPPSLDEILASLSKAGLRVYSINAVEEALKLGDARSANTLLLGYAAGLGLLEGVAGSGSMEEAVRRVVRRSMVAVEAFRRGLEIASTMAVH